MKITRKQKDKLLEALDKPELKGLVKFTSVSNAIGFLAGVMAQVGWSLDMVTGDTVLGQKGTRRLPFRPVVPECFDPFQEMPQVENCFVVFVWENLDRLSNGVSENPRFEIITYLSE
jgi:hypothetical protein